VSKPPWQYSASTIEGAAREALRRLKNDKTCEDWIAVGEMMMVITAWVMQQVGCLDRKDRSMLREASRYFEEWDVSVSNQPPLTKQERWSLREFMTNPEIRAWHAALPAPQRRRLNHPNAIINAWKNVVRGPPIKVSEETNTEVIVDMFIQRLGVMSSEERGEVLERIMARYGDEMKVVELKRRKP
jgi:hypothetical protein